MPCSYKYAPVNEPLTTGVKLIVPVTVDPYETSTLTFISGYVNVWYPVPVDLKSTNLPLLKLEVIVAPIPASDNLNVLSSNLKT